MSRSRLRLPGLLLSESSSSLRPVRFSPRSRRSRRAGSCRAGQARDGALQEHGPRNPGEGVSRLSRREVGQADFDLSTREKLEESGMLGETAEDSHLYAVVARTAEPFMPLQKDKLPDEQLKAFKKWIDLGGPYDKPLTDGPVARRSEDGRHRGGPSVLVVPSARGRRRSPRSATRPGAGRRSTGSSRRAGGEGNSGERSGFPPRPDPPGLL